MKIISGKSDTKLLESRHILAKLFNYKDCFFGQPDKKNKYIEININFRR